MYISVNPWDPLEDPYTPPPRYQPRTTAKPVTVGQEGQGTKEETPDTVTDTRGIPGIPDEACDVILGGSDVVLGSSDVTLPDRSASLPDISNGKRRGRASTPVRRSSRRQKLICHKLENQEVYCNFESEDKRLHVSDIC